MPTDTKEQILDTAERLFAESGIDAVSLRAITGEASVNLAAIHYHFGSKEALVKAVFARRLIPLNQERLALLDEVEAGAGDGPLAVEDVLRTLFAPAIRLSRDPERGETFMHLCGRFYSELGEYMQPMFEELFKEVIERFMAAFQKACPELPVKELFWRTHFAVGAMVHTMCDCGPAENDFPRSLRPVGRRGHDRAHGPVHSGGFAGSRHGAACSRGGGCGTTVGGRTMNRRGVAGLCFVLALAACSRRFEPPVHQLGVAAPENLDRWRDPSGPWRDGVVGRVRRSRPRQGDQRGTHA